MKPLVSYVFKWFERLWNQTGIVAPLQAGIVALVCFSGFAYGNGRVPATISTVLEPDPSQRILVGTTFGPLISVDAGASWRWICEPSLYDNQNLGALDPRYLISSTGAIFAGLSNGLAISRNGGCTWERPSLLRGKWITDVRASPADPRTFYAVTATTAQPNSFYISRDDGASWSPVGTPESVGFFRRVVAQGADAFVSGYDEAAGGHRRLWKYTGQSQTFEEVAHVGLESAWRVLEYVAASPRTPGLLYLESRVGNNEALFRSRDGGLSWSLVLAESRLRGYWVDTDDTLWLADARGIEVSTDQGENFSTREPLRTFTCISKKGPNLYACSPDPPWQFGTSTDGITWTELLNFQQNIVGPVACAAGTETHDLCEPLWQGLVDQLGIQVPIDASVPEDAAVVDASVPPPDGQGADAGRSTNGGEGCGCAVSDPLFAWSGLVMGLALLLGLRRSRR